MKKNHSIIALCLILIFVVLACNLPNPQDTGPAAMILASSTMSGLGGIVNLKLKSGVLSLSQSQDVSVML